MGGAGVGCKVACRRTQPRGGNGDNKIKYFNFILLNVESNIISFSFLLCPKVNYIVLLSEFFHALLLVM